MYLELSLTLQERSELTHDESGQPEPVQDGHYCAGHAEQGHQEVSYGQVQQVQVLGSPFQVLLRQIIESYEIMMRLL